MSRPKMFPKYIDLNAVMPKIESDYLNIIIDLKSFFMPYYYRSFRYIGMESEDVEMIVVKIINAIAHYRNYFAKEQQLSTKFYILYSDVKCDELLKKIPNYKTNIYNKFNTAEFYNMEVIKKSLYLIDEIVNRLPQCVFINTSDYDENAYIGTILKTTDQVSMIVTTHVDEMIPTMDHKTILLSSRMSKICLKTYDVYDIIKSIVIGSKDYGLNSSWCSSEKYDDSWREHIIKHELANHETINNPLDYEKIKKRLTNKASIDKSIYKYKEIQDFNFDILSGNMLYYINKQYLKMKIIDYYENDKMAITEAMELNDMFYYNKVQVNGLYRNLLNEV